MVLLLILASAVAVSLISFVGVATLAIKDSVFQKVLLLLVAFSAGGLMGGAFLHLLPKSFEKIEPLQAFIVLLTGFSSFFLLERFLRWRHCHEEECELHPFTYLSLIGDGLHNFIDGIVIAASYLAGVHVGIITTLAVAMHEIPQELGDFAVLIYGGFSKLKAIIFNFTSAVTAIFGAMLGYFFILTPEVVVYVLPFAAGNFLYIASSDLIPELHKEKDLRRSIQSFLMFFFGIALMYYFRMAFEH
jgi:zinc and cadmium transporter